MLLLDTNVVSALMERERSAWSRLRVEVRSGVFLCAPVAAEIRYGLSKLPVGSRKRRILESEYDRLRAHLRWVDWDERAAGLFGDWKATLYGRGKPVEDMDIAIASIALALPARLATRNLRHFSRIEDLEVSDWSAPVPTG